jgi:hypothetical protein
LNKIYYNQERTRGPTDYLNPQEENKMIKDLGKIKGVELGSRLLTDGKRTIRFDRHDQGYEMYELKRNTYYRCGIVNADEETENEDLWNMATDDLY